MLAYPFNETRLFVVRPIRALRLSDQRRLHYREVLRPLIEGALKPYIGQSEFVYCIATLLEALQWYGKDRTVFEALPHFADTLGLTDFLNIMARFNYKGRALPTRLGDMEPRLAPFLFLPKDDTAKIVIELSGDSAVMVDGLTGAKTIGRHENPMGTAYCFSHVEVENSSAVKAQGVSWFRTIVERFRGLAKQLLLMSLVANILVLAIPLFVMAVYDQVIPTGAMDALTGLVVGVLVAVFGMMAMQWIRIKIMAYIGARVDTLVGNAILERLLYLPPSYTEMAAVSTQVARIKDFDFVREFFTSSLLAMLFELPFVFVFIAVIYALGGALAWVPLLAVVVFALFAFVTKAVVHMSVRDNLSANSRKNVFQLESLTHMRAIKYLSAEATWKERYRDVSGEAIHAGYRAGLINAVSHSISEAFVFVAGLLVVLLGAYGIIDGTVTIGGLIASTMLSWRVLTPVRQFFCSLNRIDQVAASIRQINTLMSFEKEASPQSSVAPLPDLFGEIEFQRISFRYRGDVPPSLLGVSVTILPGEMVCVVGRNGSGKSTLLKLIPGLYRPQGGAILLNNLDIRQFNPIELRHAVAYLPQNTHLFYGTIEQNIRLANPMASDEDVTEALRMAGIYEEVMALPNGLATRLGDQKAQQFSMSFLQCIGLARVYVKRSKILLLDEPTSALDFAGDQQFMKVVNQLRGNATLMMITHRPAHIKCADRVLFMDHGQLIFSGPPKEVLPKIPDSYF